MSWLNQAVDMAVIERSEAIQISIKKPGSPLAVTLAS